MSGKASSNKEGDEASGASGEGERASLLRGREDVEMSDSKEEGMLDSAQSSYSGAMAPLSGESVPAIRSLTEDDPGMQARKDDYQERLKQGTPWRSPALSLGFQPPVRTLQSENPDVVARKAAYMAKRQAKKAERRSNLDNTKNQYLSLVPEVEEDVQYRFTFRVLGDSEDAQNVVKNTCASHIAHALPKSLLEKDEREDEGRTIHESVEKEGGGVPESRPIHVASACRCLSVVENPLVAHGIGKRKLAKLVFHPMTFEQDVPKCASRSESMSTTVVYLLVVNQGNLSDQLEAMSASVERMRQRGKARLRSVRAVILCTKGDEMDCDEWAEPLSDYERDNGELWKFGPIGFEDGNALHNAFSEIASVRISKSQLEDVKEEEDDDDQDDEIDEETTQDAPADASPANQKHWGDGSECSEGWQRPPVYDTEIDASEVSDSDVIEHQRIFGIEG
jgi:hypothetical protein